MNYRRASALAVLFLLSASCSKCAKTPTGSGDAAVDAAPMGVAVVDAAVAEPVAAEPDSDAAAPAGTGSGTAVKPTGASGGPFAGSYKCMNGFTVTQNGNQVTGTASTKSTSGGNRSTYSCTVGKPDQCEGMYTNTQFFTDTKKPSKEIEKRKCTLTRREDGIAVKTERSTETIFCKKL